MNAPAILKMHNEAIVALQAENKDIKDALLLIAEKVRETQVQNANLAERVLLLAQLATGSKV